MAYIHPDDRRQYRKLLYEPDAVATPLRVQSRQGGIIEIEATASEYSPLDTEQIYWALRVQGISEDSAGVTAHAATDHSGL
jgi:hypothetical protein